MATDMALLLRDTTTLARDFHGAGSVSLTQAHGRSPAHMVLEDGWQKDRETMCDTPEFDMREIIPGDVPFKDITNTVAAVENPLRTSSPADENATRICMLTAVNDKLNIALEDLRHKLDFQIKKTQYKEAQLRGVEKDRISLRAEVERLKQEVEKSKEAFGVQADRNKNLEDKLQDEISLLHKITARLNDEKVGTRLHSKYPINDISGPIGNQDQAKHGHSTMDAVQSVIKTDLAESSESPIDMLISRYFPLIQIGLLVRGRFLEDSLRRRHLRNSTRYVANDPTLVVKGDYAVHEPDYLADLALYQSHYLDVVKDKSLFEQVYAGSLEQHLAQVSSLRSTESERIDIIALWFSARAQTARGSHQGGTMFANLVRRVVDADHAVSQTIVSIVKSHPGCSHEDINVMIEADAIIQRNMDEMRRRTEELRHRIYQNGFQ